MIGGEYSALAFRKSADGLTLEYLETLGVPVLGYKSKNLAAFYKNCENLLKKYHLDHLNWKGLTIQVFSPTLLADYDVARKLFLQDSPKGHPNPDRLRELSDNLDCGFNRGVIKMRYDGQLLPC